MHQRTSLLLLAIILSALGIINAQSTNYTIKGILIDSITSETVPYATVKISKKETPQLPLKAVPTDDNGKFSISISQPGEYIFTAIFIGKKDYTQEITLGDKKTIDLGSVRIADNATSLADVMVTASKPIVQVDLDKITYSMEDDPEAKTNNVLDMLKKVPMVTVDGEENIQLKGSSNFKIYMNGKPSNMIAKNPKDILRSMPANTIKNIEVITDPGAKYDAEGVTGILNIITLKQTSMDGITGTVNARAGSYDTYGGGLYMMMKYGKVGFTGNYNLTQYHSAPNTSSTFRELKNSIDNHYLTQDSRNRNKGFNQFGSGELSIEIDTLNLINVSFDLYGGNNTSRSSSLSKTLSLNGDTTQLYQNIGRSKNDWGGSTFGADYQRTFSKKDQLLTASYQYSRSPDNSKYTNQYLGFVNYPDSTARQFSDAAMQEHTMQIDFTTPFGPKGKQHTLEAGLKYIIRLNNSESGYEYMNDMSQWIDIPKKAENDFKHRQDIISAYAGYSYKLKKWGFKAGLRYEGTLLDAKFPIDTKRNFDANYSNVVPSATVTYQLKPAQSLRAGYNMRIWRPSIWQLNPYEDTSNPLFVRQGNPNLDAEKNHNFNINYSFFNPKFNMNANLSYGFGNNGIRSITEIKDVGGLKDVSYTTYYNIGKGRNVNLSLYANWTPSAKMRIYTNGGLGYIKNTANNFDKKLSNDGYRAYGSLGLQYSLPWNMNVSGNAGYYGPYPSLQSKGTSFHYHSLSLQKDFMQKKLTIRVNANSPFLTKRTNKNETEDPDFYSLSRYTYRQRSFSINVSYKFGELKARIKKVARGIHNDDTSGGGGNQGGQGGSGGGGQ